MPCSSSILVLVPCTSSFPIVYSHQFQKHRVLLHYNISLLCLQFNLGTTANYRPFEEARKHILSLKLTSQSQFRLWAISTQRPADIPYNPMRIYSDKWVSWEHFLGVSTELYQLVKQLQAENYMLKSKNAEVKVENAQLKSKIGKLKSKIAKLEGRIQIPGVHTVRKKCSVCFSLITFGSEFLFTIPSLSCANAFLY